MTAPADTIYKINRSVFFLTWNSSKHVLCKLECFIYFMVVLYAVIAIEALATSDRSLMTTLFSYCYWSLGNKQHQPDDYSIQLLKPWQQATSAWWLYSVTATEALATSKISLMTTLFSYFHWSLGNKQHQPDDDCMQLLPLKSSQQSISVWWRLYAVTAFEVLATSDISLVTIVCSYCHWSHGNNRHQSGNDCMQLLPLKSWQQATSV